MDILLNQLIQFYLNNTINLRHLTRRIMSPQNGDRILIIDCMASLHPVYNVIAHHSKLATLLSTAACCCCLDVVRDRVQRRERRSVAVRYALPV